MFGGSGSSVLGGAAPFTFVMRTRNVCVASTGSSLRA